MTEKREHELRSYGRRRGRKPSDRQADLLKDLLPKVSLDLTKPAEFLLPVHAKHGFAMTRRRCPERADEGAERQTSNVVNAPSPQPSPQGERGILTWLEIGFGGGEHLVWQAAHNPSVSFIGCEPFEDGVVKVLSKIDSDKLSNIRLHMGDAREVLRSLPETSIARAFILFPDPWPKRKHRKRRLVNPDTLASLARVMKPGAELRIGTDIADYARTMLLAFQDEPRFQWQAASPKDWRVRPLDWPETRYEQKAEREGRVRYYFRFFRI